MDKKEKKAKIAVVPAIEPLVNIIGKVAARTINKFSDRFQMEGCILP